MTKRNKLFCKEQMVLTHQLEEWKILNEYVNKMDIGYQQSFVIVVSLLAAIATIFTSGIVSENIMKIIFIVPLGLVAIFAYISYQFRITAILRGHLAAVEDKMNEKLGEHVHLWNSALMESYMVRNNVVRNWMIVPMLFFVGLILIYCWYFTNQALQNVKYGEIIFVIYWMLILIGSLIVLPPFFRNDSIRKKTYDEIKVISKYEEYKNNEK